MEAENIMAFDYFLSLGAKLDSKDKNYELPVHRLTLAKGNLKNLLQKVVDSGKWPTEKNVIGYFLLLACVRGRSKEEIEAILNYGAQWNYTDNLSNNVLHYAVFGGNLPAVKYLISLGAIVNARNYSGETPLHMTTTGISNFKEMFEELVQSGADIYATDKYKNNLLFLGALRRMSKDDLELLVNKGVFRYLENNFGCNILHYATIGGNLSASEYFISLGAEINKRNHSLETPLHMISYARQNVSKLLETFKKAGADLNATDATGNNLLLLSAFRRTRHTDLVAIVSYGITSNQRNELGQGCLHLVVAGENVSAVEYFISIGEDVNLKDNIGETPLHQLSNCHNFFRNILNLLLEHGADINAVDNIGNSLLSMLEISEGKKELIDFVVLKGAKKSSTQCVVT